MRYGMIFAVILSGPASAGGLTDLSWEFEGTLQLGLSDRTTGAEVFAVTDATARLTYGRFTAELGLFGRADGLDTPHETYGALGIHLGKNGHLTVGVPRPAYDAFAVSQLETEFPALSIERVQQTRSAATYGAMFNNWLPYGAAYQGQVQQLSYALSAHYADTPDALVLGAGVGMAVDDWHLSGAVESADGTINAKAQAARDFGRFRAGLGYFATGAAGVADLVEGYAQFSATDRIDLTAIVQSPVDGGAASGGLTARYAITDATALQVGIGSDTGQDPFFSAGVKFDF
jgi:hypothetical protein